MSENTILIVGAGIAGLTCALSFARLQIPTQIIEAFEEPGEVGAGIQISPNAWRIVDALGLSSGLEAVSVLPKAIRLGDAVSGKIVLDMPVNTDAGLDTRFAAVHRAKLHQILWDAAVKSPLITIKTGIKLDEVATVSDGIEAHCKTSDDEAVSIKAKLIVGADGIWSNTRRFIKGVSMPKSTGRIALRAMVEPLTKSEVPVVTAWMAQKSHLVVYPVGGSDLINIIVIINGAAHEAHWNQKLDGPLPDHVEAILKQVTPEAAEDIDLRRWPLFSVKPKGVWHSDRICLIGDAAHGMEPFAAQGACMAMEDAFELAHFISEGDSNAPEDAFASYYRWRVDRVAKVAKRVHLNRSAYHQMGLGRWGRNFLFAAQPSDKFLKGLDWLYGYEARGL